jgi:hypothetical protein
MKSSNMITGIFDFCSHISTMGHNIKKIMKDTLARKIREYLAYVRASSPHELE